VRTASGTLSLCTSLGSKRRSRTFFSNFTTRCATQAESWHHATRNLASSSTGGDYLELLVLHRALAWNVDRSCVLGKMQSYGHHDMPLLLALKREAEAAGLPSMFSDVPDPAHLFAPDYNEGQGMQWKHALITGAL
jgi:hypothetical protein